MTETISQFRHFSSFPEVVSNFQVMRVKIRVIWVEMKKKMISLELSENHLRISEVFSFRVVFGP